MTEKNKDKGDNKPTTVKRNKTTDVLGKKYGTMAYCGWFSKDPLQREYHKEWGTPLHDDKMQFEYLSMEVMQCGLNFGMVLRKRDILRACFDGFDYERVADYGEDDIGSIMAAEGMIRSEKKVRAIISNAWAFQGVRSEFGTFSDYLWSFTGNESAVYRGHETGLVPASNALSEGARRTSGRGVQLPRTSGDVLTYAGLRDQ